MKIVGIIPARYASTRFPGKPLALIQGKPMIQRVYEQSILSKLDEVCIATDDNRIFDATQLFNAKAWMTSVHHESGTYRCMEVFQKYYTENFDACINIQGDEPFIHPNQINEVVDMLKSGYALATLIHPIESWEDYQNANLVKVVKNQLGEALYFSRAPIPFISKSNYQQLPKNQIFRHIGIYGFQKATLKTISTFEKSDLENFENLEQLRWLEHGIKIQTHVSAYSSEAIDTPEDLKKIKK